jgi:hypothetical protein
VSLLAGCMNLQVMSHVPVSTLSRLATLTLADIDPDRLRVAARLPLVLEPRPQGAVVTIELQVDAGKTQTEKFVLEPASEPSELAALSPYQSASARVVVYRLSTADATRLGRILTTADRASLRTIADAVDACRQGELGQGALPTTTLLRTNASGYFVLAQDLDLRSVVTEQELAAKVPVCG